MTTPDTAGSAAFLYMLRDNPALMPPAPDEWTPADADRRTRDEVHLCLRCAQRAQIVLVAITTRGLRWLDLCGPCASVLRAANQLMRDPEPGEL